MRLKKSFQLALNALFHSKLRTWLTIIGIVIGIAAVVAIVSISIGAKQQLESRLGSLGADVITISSGFSRASGPAGFGSRDSTSTATTTVKNLTSRDVSALKGLNNIEYVMGSVSGKSTMAYLTKSASIDVEGVDVNVWKDATTEQIDTGRFLTNGDSFSVVISGNLADKVFPDGIPLNSKVIIDGKTFNVVGILKEGTSFGGSSTVYMPIDIARNLGLDNVGQTEFNSISVKIKDVSQSNDTVTLITNQLMMSRGILSSNKKDFTVSSPAAMQSTVSSTLNTMSIFLGAIAAISLLVGAIGIANSMFTSVLERTRDIGVMKAIGAKNKDILLIFLINSGLIGLVGGIGGIILGTIGSGLISMLSSSASGSSARGGIGMMLGNTAITPGLLILSLVFSVLIGMIAGAIPAIRASKLNPVEALRYE